MTPTLAVLGAALLTGSSMGLSADALLRDPLASVGAPAVTGALSSLGVLVLACTAALLAGAAAVCGRARPGGDDGRFLACSAAVTALLCLDDGFQLHEALLPELGVPEWVVYAAYACGGGVYLLRWGGHLLTRTEVVVLGLAAAFLGGSLVVDLAALRVSASSAILEDGPKLLGIATLAAYFVRTAAAAALPAALPTPLPTTTAATRSASEVPALESSIDAPAAARAGTR